MNLQRRGKYSKSRRKQFATLCTLILILLCVQGICQQGPAIQEIPVKTYYAHSYYEEDGLASNIVYDMAQASNGLLWFATQKGISTFDGLRWETVKGETNLPLVAKKINLLSTQEGGMLFTGIASRRFHLMYYLNKEWHQLPQPPGAADFTDINYSNVATIEYAPNLFYVSFIYQKSLYLFNSATETWQIFVLPPYIGDWHDISHVSFFQHHLYVFSSKGLSRFHPEKKAFLPVHYPMLNGRNILGTTLSADGKELYILGENFVGRIREEKYEPLIESLYKNPPFIGHHNILIDRNNRLFFSHNAAIFKFNIQTGILEPIKINQASSTEIPTNIFEDKEGNVWFCSMRGVNKVSSFRFHTLNKESGLISDEISTILPLGPDTLLLCGNVGYSVFARNKITNHSVPLLDYNASLTRVLDATRTPDGTTYFAGTSLGVGIVDKNNDVEWFPHPEGEVINTVAYHQGRLLAGTFRGSLLSFKDGTYKPVWKKDFLYIRKIISDGQQLVLLTNNGVFKLTQDGLQIIIAPLLEASNVYSLFRWRGRTLLGTLGGLYELVNNNIEKVTEPGLQIDRAVYALLEDKQGRLWAGTDKGVFVHDKGHLINFHTAHGLAGKEVNRHAFELMPNGEIWIGTDQGVSVFNPEDDIEKEVLPAIRICDLYVPSLGTSLPAKDAEVEFDENTLEISFQTISFHIPTELNYRYKLEGLDESWIYSDNHLLNSVRYTSLPPGDYRFVVQARSSDGLWSEVAKSQKFTILRPFYTRWWFVLLILGLVVSLGFALHAFIMHKRNAEQLQKAIEEKKREIDKSERRFKAIWDATDTGMALINRRGKVLMVNPAMKSILQARKEMEANTSILQLLPISLFSEAGISKMYSNKKVVRKNIVLNLEGQALYLIITVNFVDHLVPGESLMVVGCKNITDQKLTEANNIRLNEELLRQNMSLLKKEEELANYNHELLQQREELEQALQVVEERNYELDQFVYKTSHDLRAPIASALGLLNIIQLEKDHNRLPEYLKLIGTSLEKQDTFIKAMLSFSKTTRAKNKAEGVNFKELIEQCLKDLQHLPGFKDINIQLEVIPAAAPFYSDKMKLYIILANIISNSIKYRNPHKKNFLLIQAQPTETGMTILVEDNGIGIALENQHAIFEMFYRGTELSDGSGLGLYIVKQTVEKLRGSITVESSTGKGARFTVTIPNQQHPPVGPKNIEIRTVQPASGKDQPSG